MTSAYAVELIILGALLLEALFTIVGAVLIMANLILYVGGARLQERLFANARLRGVAQRLRLDPPQTFFGTGERVSPLVWLGALVIVPAIIISPVESMSDRGAATALMAFCLVAQAKMLSLYFKRSRPAFVPEANAQ